MSQLDFKCIGEVSSQTGIAGTFEGWKTAAERTGISREDFFRQQLKTQIDLLATKTALRLSGIPVVLSGMASSSIGMAEVPYAHLPFAVDGSQASIQHFMTQAGFPHEILLISGVRSQQDVMRGEETQLTGLIALLDLPINEVGEAIFIFPGTHSKHMYIREGHLMDFETYMTGELFNLMATQSILNASVDITNLTTLAQPDIDAFKRGVGESQSSTLLNRLFTVRTNQLFDKLTRKQNALYLSGLLIGTELKNLRAKEEAQIVLCSGSNLSRFYTLAMETVGLINRTMVVPPELTDQAASVGQILLFQNQTVKETTK